MLFDLQNSQKHLKNYGEDYILIFAMKNTPRKNNIMLAHCRACGATSSFILKAEANEILDPERLFEFDKMILDDYFSAKKDRLRVKLSTLFHATKNKDLKNYLKNFDYSSLKIYQNYKGKRDLVAYYFNDTFPRKDLKTLFKRLNIVLIAKTKGGQDE